ncbi:MAG TPA: hypothetical protein VNL98_11810, partial [Gemmatimonadales bacterium]|nr:hypothetical protein [Gemmatimonadales bacterium]
MSRAVAAVLALAMFERPTAATAQRLSDACPAAPAPASPETYLEAGRAWHSWRATNLSARGPLAAESALVALRALESMGNDAALAELLARVQGGDSVPELLAIVARHEARQGRWAQALSAWRRVLALSTAPALREEALVRQAVAFGALGRADSARAAWSRAAQALPGIADWLLLRQAEFEDDTIVAFGIMAGMRTPGARTHALERIARRRQSEGNLGGALAAWDQLKRPLDMARVE